MDDASGGIGRIEDTRAGGHEGSKPESMEYGEGLLRPVEEGRGVRLARPRMTGPVIPTNRGYAESG